MKQLLTNSRLKAFLSCQRFHSIRYGLGVMPAVDGLALRFGTTWHAGLEHYWPAWALGNREAAIDVALMAMREAALVDPYELAKAEALMLGYDERWREDGYEVLAVEKEFRAPLVHPDSREVHPTWELGGKIDGIIRDRLGRVLLLEHKTSSEDITAASTYWRKLRLDSQLSVYWGGAQSLGFDIQGVLYDVVKKPGLRPLKANTKRKADESPEEYRARCAEDIASDPAGYFARGEIVRLESELREAQLDLWEVAQQMTRANEHGEAPRNADSCMRYGAPCPFWEVCAGEASLEDPHRFKKSSNVFPELSGNVAQSPKEEAQDVRTSQAATTAAAVVPNVVAIGRKGKAAKTF